jgi:hypothetical protein
MLFTCPFKPCPHYSERGAVYSTEHLELFDGHLANCHNKEELSWMLAKSIQDNNRLRNNIDKQIHVWGTNKGDMIPEIIEQKFLTLASLVVGMLNDIRDR